MIRSNLETQAPTALAVYLALTEIASEKGEAIFETTHAEIMQRSGIRSDRTVKDRLKDLQELGLIAMRENWISSRLRGPSTYSVLAVGNDYLAIGNGEVSMNTLSLRTKKNAKEKEETRVAASEADFEAMGYDLEASGKLALYDRICVQAGLGFLPVNQFNKELAEKLSKFEDLEELEEMLVWRADLVRGGEWSGRSKTLRRVIEDSDLIEPPANGDDIPF